MIPQFGDIVTIRSRRDGVKWVMTPGDCSPSGEMYVRLVRRNDGLAGRESFTTYASCCEVVERPTYKIGEIVYANGGRIAEITAIDGEIVHVRYAPTRRPFGKSGLFYRDTGQSGINVWEIAYDNRLNPRPVQERFWETEDDNPIP